MNKLLPQYALKAIKMSTLVFHIGKAHMWHLAVITKIISETSFVI